MKAILFLFYLLLLTACNSGGSTSEIFDSFTISGKLTAGGTALAGATVTLSGSASGIAATDSSGNYSFAGLQNGSYLVTPSMADYAFTQVSLSVTIDNANSTDNDFFAPAAVIRLPKTGQTTSYAAGDDGALQKGIASPNPRFIDNLNGTVTDNLTGLTWLKNANCTDTAGGVAKLSGSLTWYKALTWSNALASGVCNLTDGSIAGDWRLPNVIELESLLDLEHTQPSLPTGHLFSNAATINPYWSSTTVVSSPSSAWYVGINGGGRGYYYKYGGIYGKSKEYPVWPVRGGQEVAVNATIQLPKSGQTQCFRSSNEELGCSGTGQDGETQTGATVPDPRFIDNGNGTVSDNLTGLIWLKNADCFAIQSWEAALASANALASGACGLDDGSVAGQWRMPNLKEMLSLIDLSKVDYALPTGHPFSNVPPLVYFAIMYWSSSNTNNPASGWVISINNGYVGRYEKFEKFHVWPVRGGQ